MKNTKRNELAVCGFAAVKILEKNHPEKIQRIYFNDEQAKKFGGLCKMLAAQKKIYNKVKDESELEKLCGSVHHQGVVAMIEAPEVEPLNRHTAEHWIDNKETILCLDRVGNANNLGAIVRSAAFFGIKNIVIPVDEAQTSITTSSYRVAEGGMEFVRIWSVKSLAHFLRDVDGKMVRFATHLKAKKNASEMAGLRIGKGAVVVLGNEEEGISKEVMDNCDYRIIIPYFGIEEGKRSQVESLNVAQAASILLYELRK